jgi:hypothetical protein
MCRCRHAGAGTIGLEILEQATGIGTVVVPMGDTALIRGVAAAVRSAAVPVRIIGVQAATAPSYHLSWQRGEPVPTATCVTTADGLATRTPHAPCTNRFLTDRCVARRGTRSTFVNDPSRTGSRRSGRAVPGSGAVPTIRKTQSTEILRGTRGRGLRRRTDRVALRGRGSRGAGRPPTRRAAPLLRARRPRHQRGSGVEGRRHFRKIRPRRSPVQLVDETQPSLDGDRRRGHVHPQGERRMDGGRPSRRRSESRAHEDGGDHEGGARPRGVRNRHGRPPIGTRLTRLSEPRRRRLRVAEEVSGDRRRAHGPCGSAVPPW